MNESTPSTLIQTARSLFAAHGFNGTSVRSITDQARVNLGAITYHFGSKQALYEAVIETAIGPSSDRFAAAADRAGAPLDRVEQVVRAFFSFLHDNPDLPQLIAQQLIGTRPVPDAALRIMQTNIGIVASLIAEGQADGTIRPGDARLMALSIGAQPIWLTLARRALQAGVHIDQDDPETRSALVQSVVHFVRAGLAAHPEMSQ